jgi:nucleoside-diphosphate-sugar epimerase
MPSRAVFVAGASSQVGRFLVPRLLESGRTVYAGTRDANRREPPPGALDRWTAIDGDRIMLPAGEIAAVDTVIGLAPVADLPALVAAGGFPALTRIIAFSSTSRFTKRESADPREQAVAAALADGEAALERLAGERGIAWTIFRPTLIYGPGDRSLSTIAGFVRRWKLFPLTGGGRGLRQPVHADDLALACMQALDHPRTYGKAYNLSGARPLSYREMVEAVFRTAGLEPRFVEVPLGLLRFALRVASLLPLRERLTPEMADRINQDLSFGHEEAARDFGFAPRPFQP